MRCVFSNCTCKWDAVSLYVIPQVITRNYHPFTTSTNRMNWKADLTTFTLRTSWSTQKHTHHDFHNLNKWRVLDNPHCLVAICKILLYGFGDFTETRLRSKVVVCWLPNIADFFFSLARLIEDLERQLSSASYDSSEFLFRHFDEYKRTLATLSSRFCETYGCLEIGKFTLSTLNRTGTHRFNH